MFISTKRNRAAKGFTLTEAAIVLGIVGLILGAIWVAAAAVYSNMRTNTANRQLMTIVQNIRALYASSATIDAGVLTTNLNNAGVFPSDMTASGAPLNGWGGAVVAGGGPAGDVFYVQYGSLPKDACIDMAMSNSGTGRDNGLVGVATTGVNTATTFPLTLANANTLCPAATPTNSVSFTFKLKG